jgi:hypothetical protein
MNHSVIYATNELNNWIDIADRLNQENGWDPAYWVAPDSLLESLTRIFPEAVLHSSYNADQGIPPTEYEDVDLLPIDAELLEQYQPYEYTALRMMDRMDVGNSFSYDERIRHYHRLLRYWQTIVRNISPSVGIFSNSPHTVSDYILYAVCVEENVEVAIFTPTKLPGALPHYHYLRRRVDRASSDLIEKYESLQNKDVKLTQSSEAYLDEISEAKTDSKPLHAGGEKESRSFLQYLQKFFDVRNYPDYIRLLFTYYKTTTKKRSSLPEESKILGYENVIHNFRGNIYKKKLERCYQNLAQSPDFTTKFVYFPLHYQPERATLPKGGRYHDLYLVAEMLSQYVPSDWNIVIKEHPYQFSSSGVGQQGRSTYNYDDFNELDNVVIVPIDTSSVQLIKNAEAVATVTGTAGWEAINMGTPAVIFGNAWYRVCSGANNVRSISDVSTTIQSVVNGMSVDNSDIRRFVAAVESVGYRIPGHEPESGYIDNSTEVDRYVEALTEFVEL